jgi:hypothetical protein
MAPITSLTSVSIPQLKNSLSNPIFTSILESRAMGLAIIGAAILHTGLTILGLPSWSCPVRELFGIPCPGCGLSRAIGALLQRDWETSLAFHALAPFFLLALIIIAITTFLPATQRHWAINQIKMIERHTGITGIFLIGLVLYWLTRLLFFREAFINLIMG